jgi:NAD(P)-dependent dehydrogenase (short-subunit alcohol dehydrogenase family)
MRVLVFGGTGTLGSAIANHLRSEGWETEVAARAPEQNVSVDLSQEDWAATAAARGTYSGVVWAQGANLTSDVLHTEPQQMRDLYEANVVFVTSTLRELVDRGALASPARGVVVSSVWQITARANKLAYVASKSALAGVVPSIAADLADRGFAINGVLPGVIDTPMTRAQLSAVQLEHVRSETLGGSLATPEDVASAVGWLVHPRAQGINGQWIAVDNGWSTVRSV